jgi:hypothetical protein
MCREAGEEGRRQQIRVVDGGAIAGQIAEVRAAARVGERHGVHEEAPGARRPVQEAGISEGLVRVEERVAGERGGDRVRLPSGDRRTHRD